MKKYHCAIVLIGHMNKNSNGKSSYRGLGSIDFQAAARSVLIVGRIKDEPEIRVVCQVKSISPDARWYFTEFEAKDSEALRIKKVKLRNYGFKGTFDIYEG